LYAVITANIHRAQWPDRCWANRRRWLWCHSPCSSSQVGNSCLQGTEVYFHQRWIKVCLILH